MEKQAEKPAKTTAKRNVELIAMGRLDRIMQGLEAVAAERVLTWLWDRYCPLRKNPGLRDGYIE